MTDNKGRSKVTIVIAIALILCVVGIGIYFFTSCKLQNINIIGESRYSDEEIKKMTITKATDNYTLLFCLRYRLLVSDTTVPFIEKIDVEMTDKNSVNIYVYSKAVIGCVKQMDEYMYFDKDGLVVECSKERIEGIPLVTGIEFKSIVLKKKLEVVSEDLYKVILNITMLLEKNGINAEEVEFTERKEVVLKVDGSTVLLGRKDSYDFAINNLNGILNMENGVKYKYDMRSYSQDNMRVTAKAIE